MTWPTLRMLRSLKTGWLDAEQAAQVAAENWRDLPPLDQLAHPGVQIAQGAGENAGGDRFTRHDGASKAAGYLVLEARDRSTGVGWRTAIAKVDDEYWALYSSSHDAFHSRVASAFSGGARYSIEPSPDDIALLRLKRSQAQVTHDLRSWREGLVQTTLAAFREAWVSAEGQSSVPFPEPPPSVTSDPANPIAGSIQITFLREEGTAEAEAPVECEMLLVLTPPGNAGLPEVDVLLTTVLPVINPAADTWTKLAQYTRDGKSIAFPVELSTNEIASLLFASEVEVSTGDEAPVALPDIEPTTRAHFVSSSAIVESVVHGKPLRTACGRWLVSQQNPDGMPVCGECEEQLPDFGMVRDLLRKRLTG